MQSMTSFDAVDTGAAAAVTSPEGTGAVAAVVTSPEGTGAVAAVVTSPEGTGAVAAAVTSPGGAPRPSWHAEDVLSAHNELERGAPFCANPSCDLHVRWVDRQVEGGSGNWVTLPDGRVFGRGRYGGRMLCDACGTRRGPVRLEAPVAPRPLTPSLMRASG